MSDSRKRQKGLQGQSINVSVATTSIATPSPALGSFLPFLTLTASKQADIPCPRVYSFIPIYSTTY
jgi:hypothetical protein